MIVAICSASSTSGARTTCTVGRLGDVCDGPARRQRGQEILGDVHSLLRWADQEHVVCDGQHLPAVAASVEGCLRGLNLRLDRDAEQNRRKRVALDDPLRDVDDVTRAATAPGAGLGRLTEQRQGHRDKPRKSAALERLERLDDSDKEPGVVQYALETSVDTNTPWTPPTATDSRSCAA